MGDKAAQQVERKPHDGIIRRQVAIDVRSLDQETRSFDMIASTASIDSHGDIVEQNFVLNRYKKNPVVLWYHNNFGFLDGSRPEDFLPIGKSSKIKVENEALQMRMTLVSGTETEEPLVSKIWRRVEQGIQRASSIGFRPGLVHEEKTPGGVIYHLDENEIYEVSLVPIGSNADAVMKGILERDREWFKSVAKPWTNRKSAQVPANVGTSLEACREDNQHGMFVSLDDLKNLSKEEILEKMMAPLRAFDEKGAVPYYAYPPKDTESWDASAAEARVREWATSDGEVDWSKYAKAFAWYDESKADDFGSYKLPHHDVYNGGLITSRAGVIAAGNAIQGARGGTSIPSGDVPKVKQHLEKHYAQFDLVAPWHKSADENQSANQGRENEERTSNMDLEKMKAELEKAQKDILDLRVQKGIADEKLKIAEDKLSLADGKVKALEASLESEKSVSKKLGEDLAAASERMEKAEAGVVELMVDSFVGTKITPAEKAGYVELALGTKSADGKTTTAGIGHDRVKAMITARPELKLLKSVTVEGKSPAEKNAPGVSSEAQEDEDPSADIAKAASDNIAKS